MRLLYVFGTGKHGLRNPERIYTPFTLAHDALLRPSRFAAYLEGGWGHIGRAALAIGLWLGATFALTGAILPQMLPIPPGSLIQGMVMAPMLAMMLAGLGVMMGSKTRSVRANTAFWLLHCQLAVTPPLTLLLTFGMSNLPFITRWEPLLVIVLLLLMGFWIGTMLVVMAMHQPHLHQSEHATVRWLVGGAALLLAGILWWSPTLHGTNVMLVLPPLVGLSIGMLRPLSWLWEAPFSLGLTIAGRLGMAPADLHRFHPVNLDELGLLPLPGLRSTLIRVCRADLETGATWLIALSHHPGHYGAVRGALHAIIRQGTLAHPLLFWLSTCPEGCTVLHTLREQPRPLHPLIATYAALSDTIEPGAWPAIINRHQSALADQNHLPGNTALRALLETGMAVLTASRWSDTLPAIHGVPKLTGVEMDALWMIVHTVQSWLTNPEPVLVSERLQQTQNLRDEIRQIDGWPGALLAATSEHLLFLITIEQRQGAWVL